MQLGRADHPVYTLYMCVSHMYYIYIYIYICVYIYVCIGTFCTQDRNGMFT